MHVRNIIESVIKQFINENLQLADKIYFNTGKLSDEDKKYILNITGGDNFTKLISDIYFSIINHKYKPDTTEINNILNTVYNEAKNYNKNTFPIIGYDVYNSQDPVNVYQSFLIRKKIIDIFKKLPSIASRNLKNDIRSERNYSGLKEYHNDLEYFYNMYSYLNNRDENTRIKILRKIFKGNTSLSDMMRFVDDKQNYLGGVEFTADDIYQLSQTEDMEIIYNNNNILIVRVDSPQAIKKIGCNSLWCFTYGSGFDNAYRQWNNYSHNDMVYVIVNFNVDSDSEEFMHVLIKPLMDEDDNFIEFDEDNEYEYPLFNMANENYSNPYYILKDLFGEKYKEIIVKYLNFEY